MYNRTLFPMDNIFAYSMNRRTSYVAKLTTVFPKSSRSNNWLIQRAVKKIWEKTDGSCGLQLSNMNQLCQHWMITNSVSSSSESNSWHVPTYGSLSCGSFYLVSLHMGPTTGGKLLLEFRVLGDDGLGVFGYEWKQNRSKGLSTVVT